MQLLNVATAKSIWLFDINELNPSGKAIFAEALPWLAERYLFQKYPASIGDLGDGKENKNGYIFKTGSFQTENTSVQVDLGIYNDGLIADTWASTETGDLFLEEVLRSASARYGLALRSDTVIRKLYVSELNVRMDDLFSHVHDGLEKFTGTLNRLFARHGFQPYRLTGMIFSPDVAASSYKPPGFMVERKIGTSFKDNRYWSKSPFTTTDHLNALEELERILTS